MKLTRISGKEIITDVFKKLGEQCPHSFLTAHHIRKKDCYLCLQVIERDSKVQLEADQKEAQEKVREIFDWVERYFYVKHLNCWQALKQKWIK